MLIKKHRCGRGRHVVVLDRGIALSGSLSARWNAFIYYPGAIGSSPSFTAQQINWGFPFVPLNPPSRTSALNRFVAVRIDQWLLA